MSPARTALEARQSLGTWNAYVIRGTDRADRSARLAEVPEHLRDRVSAHVVCYFRVGAKVRKRENGLDRSLHPQMKTRGNTDIPKGPRRWGPALLTSSRCSAPRRGLK